jgi:hypothetical protein
MAKANRSERMRKVHTAIYFRDGCTRAAKGDHPSLARDGTKPGEAVAGPATPIAWPLYGGALPQPEPWPDLGEMFHRAAAMGVIPGAPGAL